MNETNGDGVGRIVDASGVSSIVNNCFTMLRYLARRCQNFVMCRYSCQSLVFVRKGGKIVLIGLLKVCTYKYVYHSEYKPIIFM